MSALLLTLLAAGPIDPLAKLSSMQVTGWSPDEAKFSVRGFELDDSEEAHECDGYVDHEGKKFMGKLVVAAYERGKLVQSFVVQDYPDCTSPAKAKEVLTAAKKKFAELGIDLTLKGRRVDCAKGCDLGRGGAIVFEDATKKIIRDEEMSGTLKGALRVFVQTAKVKTKLFEKTVKETFTLMMGGRLDAVMLPAELSPNGSAVVLRAGLEGYNGRSGTWTTVYSLGYYAWDGENLVAGGVPKPYIPAPASK